MKTSKFLRTSKMALVILLIALGFYSCSKTLEPVPEADTQTADQNLLAKGGAPKLSTNVPCEGNSWVLNNPTATDIMVVSGGIKNWTDSNDIIRTYFYATQTGQIGVGLKAKFDKATTLNVTLNGTTQQVTLPKSSNFKNHYVGDFSISQVGYQFVELEAVSTTGSHYGEISDIQLGDNAWKSNLNYVDSEWFYWGRRGPSVHLNYEEPAGKDLTWFYNEITVPSGKDIVGSYYMAAGFSGGYYGIQVNSETERRVLFSIWSSYTTDDPNQIPSEYTVSLLGKGNGVTVGEFGGEGSGAQTYFLFDWQPDTTYKFLVKAESVVSNATDYTAYFYAPELGEWQLIASLRRPYPPAVHLENIHSFLENFATTTGDTSRKGFYSNQWAYDTDDVWHEITQANFTFDSTADSGARLDYNGGVEGNSFYLKNCGFFNDATTTPKYTVFTRTANGVAPNIDFSQLEVPSIPIKTVLDRTNWSIIDFSTQEDNGGEGSTGRATDVLDDDLNTYWHSCWSGCDATPPHHITVDTGQSNTADGFRFSQRQSLSRAVKDIEIQISSDNSNWQSLGDFVLQNSAASQDIDLSSTQTFRYFKFIVKTAHDGSDNGTMAEISVYTID